MQIPITKNPNSNDIYLQNNQQQVVKTNKHPCPFENCTKSFPFRYRLKYHISMHLNKKKHKCKRCDMRFNTVPILKQHEKIHEPKKYTCHHCSLSFTRISYLKQHKKTSSHRKNLSDTSTDEEYKPIKHYKCDLCYKIFPKREKLATHHKQEHPGKRPYICDVCNVDFLSPQAKVKHKKIKHNGESLLETSSQKTISNNNNQNTYQDNNQHNSLELTDDTMFDIKQAPNDIDALFGIKQDEQDLNGVDTLFGIKQDPNNIDTLLGIKQDPNEINTLFDTLNAKNTMFDIKQEFHGID